MRERKCIWLKALVGGIVGLVSGCANDRVTLSNGYLPPASSQADSRTAAKLLVTSPDRPAVEKPPQLQPDGKPFIFELPSAIPGAETPMMETPRFAKDTPADVRDEAVRKNYPTLTPVTNRLPVPAVGATSLSLSDLQQLALANSPRIRRATAEVEVAYGQVVQAGVHPNPIMGYQVDQWQPRLNIPPGSTGSGRGQQGAFFNLLIKTAGKLTLAQQVAGYDHINALVAVRKAEVEVTTQVRTAYFSALSAQQSVDVNTALVKMSDEVYQLQLKRVSSGIAAGYEPFSLHALTVQARNALVQAEAGYRSAWKQLAAAIGQPDLPIAPLTGRADTPPPVWDLDIIKARLLEQHTDLLTVRNQYAQAQTNLTLQKRTRISDVQANTIQQYDNLAQTYQFGIQLGVQIPISDRNQGNILSARAKIASASENLLTTENELLAKLWEVYGRYESNVKVAKNYREQVLPDLTQAYRGVVRQHQLEPDKVGFSDVVTAQQNLAQALQAYLAAVDAQWKAVIDLGTTGQLDELFPDDAKLTPSK